MAYHPDPITGNELTAKIGTVTGVAAFNGNPHAEGPSAADFYGMTVATAETTAPSSNGPETPSVS